MQTAELIKNQILSESETVQLREIFIGRYCTVSDSDHNLK